MQSLPAFNCLSPMTGADKQIPQIPAQYSHAQFTDIDKTPRYETWLIETATISTTTFANIDESQQRFYFLHSQINCRTNHTCTSPIVCCHTTFRNLNDLFTTISVIMNAITRLQTIPWWNYCTSYSEWHIFYCYGCLSWFFDGTQLYFIYLLICLSIYLL